MTSILAGPGFGGNQTTSRETKSLQDIDLRKHNFVNKDFVRNMAWLNQSVTTLSSYSQLLQKGVDQANQNFLEQIQGFIADLLVMFAGFEPTGVWSFGDLKHVIQGIGALLGINPETPFPLNLAEAAWHLFNSYVVPLPQFTDLIFDAVIAWAETLGLSDEAIDAIQNFDNAVVALYNGIEDSFGNLGVAVKRMLNNLGLGGGWLELGPLNELWDDVKDLVADIIEGPQDLLLNVLSKIVVIDFKAMTWMVNLMNPQNWLAALGLNFLGPQILPEISGSTVDWTVTANANTGWVFDSDTSYPNSAGGSFKTNGNGSSKRILTQDTFACAFGESYAVIGQLKWDSIPAGVDSFGPCIVFYTGAAEIAQINVDAVPGHGATGGWQQVTQSVAVPTNADGFRVGARISAGVNTGTVWIDELSCSKSQSWDEALSSLLLSWTPVKIFQSLLDVFKGGVNGVIADVVDRIQHLIPGSGLFDGGFISGFIQALNVPSLDASKIGSGQFAMSMINGLLSAGQIVLSLIPDLPGTRIISAILASIVPSLDASKIGTGTFGDTFVPIVGALRDALGQAIYGGSANYTAAQVKTALQNIPGANIVSAVLATIIPTIDASKIGTGTFAQSMIANLVGDLANRLLTNIFDANVNSGVNQVIDPSFEDTTIYRKEYGCTWAYSTEQKHSGTNSIKMITRPSGTVGDYIYMMPHQSTFSGSEPRPATSAVKVSEGDKFLFEAWIYGPASNAHTGGQPRLNIIWGSADGTDTTASTSLANITDNGTLPNDTWYKMSAYFTVPAGKRYMWPRLYVGGTAPGNIYYWDDVVLRETTDSQNIVQAIFGGTGILSTILSTVVPSLDASKIGSGAFAQSMITGLENFASWLRGGAKSSANLVPDPGFDNDQMWSVGGYRYGSISTTQKHSGSQSYLFQGNGSSWQNAYCFRDEINGPYWVSCQPNDKFYMESWIFPKATNVGAAGTLYLILRWKDSTGVNAETETGSLSFAASSLTKGQWQKKSQYFTVPAGYDQCQAKIQISSSVPTGDDYWYDDVVVRETTDSQNIVSALTGAVGATISTILATVVPSLDASKIGSGQFAQTMITGLVTSAGKIVRSLIGIGDFENLIPGGDFEDDDHGFSLGTGRTIATDQYHSGTRSYKFSGTAGSVTYAGPPITLKEGEKLYAEIWARKDSSYNATDARLRLGSNPGNVNHFNLNFKPADIGSNNTWVKLTATSTAYPAGATTLNPSITMTGMTAGNLWIDDIVVRRIKPDALLPDLKELRDNIVQAILGGSGTGYLASEVKTHMENVREKSLDWVDGFFNAITGGNSADVATATAASQAAALADSIVANASAIAQLQAQQSGGFNGGIAGGDDFERVDPTDLDAGGTQWYRYNSGDTSRVLAIEDGHNARLTNTTSDEGATRTWARRQSGAADYQTVTDYQVGTMVFSSTVNSADTYDPASNSIMLRCSSDGNHFVEAEVGSGFMSDQATAQLYYSTTGIAGRTALSSKVSDIYGGNSAGATWTFEAGTTGGLRIFKLKLNGATKITYTDAGSVTSAGASYRGWGFGQSAPAHGTQYVQGLDLPAAITRITIADNMPAPTVGNGFRVTRATTSGVNVTTGKLPNSFLDTVDRISAGWTFTGGSNNGVTVPYTGWYIFELRLYTATDLGIGDEARLVLYNGANECARGRSPVLDATGVGTRNPLFTSVGFHDTFLIYCTAGDIIYPGAYTSITLSCPGNASNNSVYFTGTYVGPQPIVTAS